MKVIATLLFVMLIFTFTLSKELKTLEEDFDIFELFGEFIEVKIHDTAELEKSKAIEAKNLEIDKCIQATSNMTMYLYEYPYSLIFEYSFKDIDDLGNYYSCNYELAGVAQYYSLNVNVTNIPFNLRFGLCIPVECTQNMMNGVSNQVNDFMISVMNLMSNFQELEFINKYGLGIQLGFVAPKEALNHIRAGKEIPAIFVASIFLIFFILCCIFTCVHTLRAYLLEAIYKRLRPVCKRLKSKRPELSCECAENLVLMRSFLNQSVDNSDPQNQNNIKELSDQVQTIETRYIPSGRSSSMTDLKIMDSLEVTEGMYKSNYNRKSKLLKEIQHVADELSEIERIESKNIDHDKYIEIFSFKSNIDYLYKSNTLIKYDKKNDLECMNLICFIVGTWGVLLSSPYYLLATPIFNVWRFLILFGQPLVVIIFSGYCAPQLIILLSSFFGFIMLDKKYEEVNRSTVSFLKVSGFILLKKYVKFFVLTTVATAFTLYISPFIIDSSSYYTSGISYETCYNDWWWNLLMVGNFAPTSLYGMTGCMPWLWILSAVFQFWCILPWIVILYYKSRWLTYTILTILSFGSTALTLYYVYTYDFKVGLLAIENLKYNVFDNVYKSPFTKLQLLLIGLLLSRFYLATQRHKNQSKEQQNWILKKVYNSNSIIFKSAIWLIFLLSFVFFLFSPRDALMNAYSWTKNKNAMFYAFSQFIVIFDLFLVLFMLFTKNAEIFKQFCENKIFAVYSKLAVGLFLIYPTVMFLIYTVGPEPNYASYPSIIYYVVHHLVVGYLLSFVITLVVLLPSMQIMNRVKMLIT